MSLVAYASSDSSDEENEIEEKNSVQSCVTSSQVLSKKREPKKISIPSLKEFKDEDPDEVPKKKIAYKGGSSLLGMLPQPKNCTTLSKPGFTPYVLTKKQDIKTNPSKLNDNIKKSNPSPTPSVTSSSKISSTPPKGNQSAKLENDDDDDVVTSSDATHSGDLDFFSLNTDQPPFKPVDSYVVKEQTLELPVPAVSFQETEMNFAVPESSQNLPEPSSSSFDEQNVVDGSPTYVSAAVGSHEDLSMQEPSLSEEGFLKLQGRRKKFEDVNIIDVNVDDQLTDRNEMLMKSLTQEVEHRPFKRRHDMPTQQQKRKHQITYLAFQAKEREMDLKNQWAMNSRTRRETQAKYGF
ncbi:proline-rich protein PRCC-like [Uloborus diversus]|uniref:proline-rich protein PRCC-like n=1 Tax=Uloborus diversus TaxID=327109 RepID=UPI00240A449B|nr:proline-rich protein PRCC-like [Uloborus diversus]